MEQNKLAPMQDAFCLEYPKDLNGTQAAIRAGYSPKTAEATASRLLRKDKVQARLSEIMSKREEETKIDLNYVLNRLVEIDQMDAADILDEEDNLLPVRQWPKVWRQMISGFDVKEMISGTGSERETIGYLKKIKWPDKIKNIELLGKHVNIGAWREQHEVKGEVAIVQLSSQDAAL